MAKKKRGQANASVKARATLWWILIIILVGGYYFLKRDNKLPQYIEEPVESVIKETVQKGDRVKDKILDTVESIANRKEGSEDASVKQDGLNLKLEIPVSTADRDEIILKRMAYTLSYNEAMKNPNWVAWELTRKETYGKEERSNNFVPDPDLSEPRAKSNDYTRTGYDRGHMAPAADMKWSGKAMEQSFYMSNICPQNQKLNRGDWGDLEEVCRKWAKKYGTVYIACGPIYDKRRPKRIGANKIAVPDRFFKVVLIYNRKDPMALGFLFPNAAHSQDLSNYQVTVDSIEQITGFDFFSKVPDSTEKRIEAEIRKLPSTK